MLNYLKIPQNLNLSELIKDKLPLCKEEKRRGLNEQNLAYICNCIYSALLTHKEDYYDGMKAGYVPLSSKYLKNIVPDYKNCIDFLMNYNVILRTEYYIPDKTSYRYSFHPNYIDSNIKKIPLVGCLKSRLSNYYKSKETRLKGVANKKLLRRKAILDKTLLSEKFRIDSKSAKRSIHENYIDKKREARKIFEKNEKEEDYLKKLNALKLNKWVITHLTEIINEKMFETIIDESGWRYHSPITRLPKYLRKYLTYDGKPLIALDVKNSQPYFSLFLLKKSFYNESNEKKGILGLKKLDDELYELLKMKNRTFEPTSSFSSIFSSYTSYISPNPPRPSPIMLLQIWQILTGKGDATLENYRNDVLGGVLYDKLVDVPKTDPKYYEKRQRVKKNFLTQIYKEVEANWENKKIIQEYTIPFKVFTLLKSCKTGREKVSPRYKKHRRNKKEKVLIKDTFDADIIRKEPESFIKLNEERNYTTRKNKDIPDEFWVDEGYTKLATLLQRIESYLLLDVICLKLTKEHPEIPLVTIHDSIATTEEYVEYVKEAIKEILEKEVGDPPRLEQENWGMNEEI